MKYFCKIRYVGTDFFGYQVQPDKRTVQGVLNTAAEAVFGVPCLITGCSRTDSGVHADAFCLTVEPVSKGNGIPPERLPLAFQGLLPPDLSLYEASCVPDDFHARYDVKCKTYRYKIFNSRIDNPFYHHRAWQVRVPLDFEKMREAAPLFVGKRDFSSFMTQGSSVSTTVRTVYDSHMEREGDFIVFSVTADGFLYNMVRIMTGTLVAIGKGKLPPEAITEMLLLKNRVLAGETAPPDGLYLSRVEYGN